MSATHDTSRFVSNSTYSNGTSINSAMSAFLAKELTSVTTAVREDSAPLSTALSKRSSFLRPSPPGTSKRPHRDHLDDGSNDGSSFSDFDSHSGAESSEGGSSISYATPPIPSEHHLVSEVARARDRASRRARRAAEASKPLGKKKAVGTLQSKDGARQRLKCLCKQYLTKFQAHPSTCVPQFLTCKQHVLGLHVANWSHACAAGVRATKFKKADTRCNCPGGPAPTCDCIGCAHCRLERTVQLCQDGGMNWPHKATGSS
jgi:hypothetical protein